MLVARSDEVPPVALRDLRVDLRGDLNALEAGGLVALAENDVALLDDSGATVQRADSLVDFPEEAALGHGPGKLHETERSV